MLSRNKKLVGIRAPASLHLGEQISPIYGLRFRNQWIQLGLHHDKPCGMKSLLPVMPPISMDMAASVRVDAAGWGMT